MTTNLVIVAALLERLRYLFPEANPESDLISKVNDDLRPVREQLKQIIEYADANDNINADEKAKNFGREIMRLSYNFEDLIESYVLEVTSRRNGFLNRIFKIRSCHQNKVIEKLREELAGMIIQACKPSDTSPKHHVLAIVEGGRAGLLDSEEIIRMEDAEKELKSALVKGRPQLNWVSICGMGGIGKTTLARKVYEHREIVGHFRFRPWVCVSQECQTREMLREILSSVTLVDRSDTMDMTEEDLAERISKILKGKRYLIVLDDIWSADAWLSIRIVFPNDNNGSRILITTRMRDVAQQVGGLYSHIHMMRPLEEAESWKLFRHKAGLNGAVLDSKIKQVVEEKISRCGGVPLAIVMLARSLRGIPLKHWKLVLEHLSTGSDDSLFNVLNLSYENLPLHLRPCLLYLGNFPKDAEIETDTLCQLWMAEGLISIEDKKKEETMMNVAETMMKVAERYLDELDGRSLVQIREEVSGQRRFKSCRIIHDLMRDICKTKGKEYEFFEVVDLGEDEFLEVTDLGDENQTMISANRRAIHLDEHECTNARLYGKADYLRSLLFFNSSRSGPGYMRPREIPNLNNFIWLRVLYLYAVDFKHGKSPKGIEKLVHLRYLSFRECYLVELSSSVSNMLYLQTLDLRIRKECEMSIPDVFHNLERLKYLYLPLAYRNHNHEKLHLGSLKELEILENFDPNLCNADDILQFTNLKVFAVTTEEGDVAEILKFLNAVGTNSSMCSTSLKFRNFNCYTEERLLALEKVLNSSALRTLGVEGYFSKFPKFNSTSSELTEIALNGCELVEDPMQILEELPKLRILVLEVEAYVGKEMECSSGFPELRYLKLSKLYNLEMWEVKEAMPNLCTLVIESCKKLQMLPEELQFRYNLLKLEIASMPDEFVGRIQESNGTAGEDFYKIQRVLPNVKVNGKFLILEER